VAVRRNRSNPRWREADAGHECLKVLTVRKGQGTS
jgi:hypothetical protein